MKKFILILVLLFCFSSAVQAKDKILEKLEKTFSQCTENFQAKEKECSEIWSMKCYSSRMETHKNVQQCYKLVTISLFEKFYGLSKKEAEEKFDTYNKFIYDQYLFIFSETNFCKKNNCGISLYLYSEYATTEELSNYVNKIIGAISARN